MVTLLRVDMTSGTSQVISKSVSMPLWDTMNNENGQRRFAPRPYFQDSIHAPLGHNEQRKWTAAFRPSQFAPRPYFQDRLETERG